MSTLNQRNLQQLTKHTSRTIRDLATELLVARDRITKLDAALATAKTESRDYYTPDVPLDRPQDPLEGGAWDRTDSYEGWRARGRQVAAGQSAKSRFKNGDGVVHHFDYNQTVPRGTPPEIADMCLGKSDEEMRVLRRNFDTIHKEVKMAALGAKMVERSKPPVPAVYRVNRQCIEDFMRDIDTGIEYVGGGLPADDEEDGSIGCFPGYREDDTPPENEFTGAVYRSGCGCGPLSLCICGEDELPPGFM